MTVATLPRIGFLGAGWIGRARMQSLAASGFVTPAAVADIDRSLSEQAAAEIGAQAFQRFDDMLAAELDGMVIATPSALHAAQAVAALEHGLAVFCQKPLARDANGTRTVLSVARAADRLLAVDLSYRHTAAVRAIADVLASGDVGDVYAADLVFHNAYGPDKPWFMRRSLSGGGCLMDLGTHLVDLALWLTASRTATVAWARLLHQGRQLEPGSEEVEDFAVAELELDSGASARVACSWFLPAGREAVIEATFYGTRGAVSMRNVGGSFYEFAAYRQHGTQAEQLVGPPDEWGGRAIADWGRRLAAGSGYDPDADELERLADVLDEIYAW
jgi:predicted dehydrogenase